MPTVPLDSNQGVQCTNMQKRLSAGIALGAWLTRRIV